ncbi:uncharacterized protein [Argopecten irradians]|uniref:uncharacterized protein n=1 Tax=Argopecten irradians TaxID=31199 RepID=UPI003712A7E3
MAASIPKRKHEDNHYLTGGCMKCRVDNCSLQKDHIHENFTANLLKDIAVEIRSICDEDCFSFVRICPLTILNSNAVDGAAFSRAYCRVGDYGEQYPFVCLFRKGLDILMNYLDEQETPSDPQENLVLDSLLHFLIQMTDADNHIPAETLEELEDVDVAIFLANHLFAHLATSSHFLINDHHCKGDRIKCPCFKAQCQLKGQYSDTSIGNRSLWHGHLDIIVNNEIIVKFSGETDSDDLRWKPFKVKQKSHLTRNAEIMAETIVFSFLQKKNHPEDDHFLYPCIGIKGDEMVVYFYDAEHDVMIESTPVPLHVKSRTSMGHINLTAVVVSWLVINHKYLCSGLPDVLQTKKAHFFDTVESKLSAYQNELQFGCQDDSVNVTLNFNERKEIVHDPYAQKLEKDRIQIIEKITSERM